MLFYPRLILCITICSLLPTLYDAFTIKQGHWSLMQPSLANDMTSQMFSLTPTGSVRQVTSDGKACISACGATTPIFVYAMYLMDTDDCVCVNSYSLRIPDEPYTFVATSQTGSAELYPPVSTIPMIPPSNLLLFLPSDVSGGAWTPVQRRVDGSLDFYKTWNSYVHGFSDAQGNLWLGLEQIHQMTSDGETHELYITLQTHDLTSYKYAHYSSFTVGDAASDYMLTASGYSGTAGDSLTFHSGSSFGTYDNPNVVAGQPNYPSTFHGAWWFGPGLESSLNGPYDEDGSCSYGSGVIWNTATSQGKEYSHRAVEMKVR